MKATTKLDRKTGQFLPAIIHDDGTIFTHSPGSFEQPRAQAIAEQILKTIEESLSKNYTNLKKQIYK